MMHRLRPRILVDVSKIDMSTTLLGYKMQSPIIVAPTGMHKYAHPEGLFSHCFMVLSMVPRHKLQNQQFDTIFKMKRIKEKTGKE